MEPKHTAFTRPRASSQPTTAHLFVANCGPAVGLSLSAIHQAFSIFGPVDSVQVADESGSRVIVSFSDPLHAQACRHTWNGVPCSTLNSRVMYIQYSVPKLIRQVEAPIPVHRTASETKIPGLFLYTDFIKVEEEQALLVAVDERCWQILAKRRVQHYGYEFNYKTRNVDTKQKIGELPHFVEPLVEKISRLDVLNNAGEPSLPLDQLTVNEYPSGVGLSPHIDTHSAFEGAIISLSLAGSCVMEFRRNKTNEEAHLDDGFREYEVVSSDRRICENETFSNKELQNSKIWLEECQETSVDMQKCPFERRAIFLPQRSLLVLSCDARYGWYHYIPHHKVDIVDGNVIQRSPRRVSFTFRKVRVGSCHCKFQRYCDSQVLIDNTQPVYTDGAENQICADENDIKGKDVRIDIETSCEVPCAVGHTVWEVNLNFKDIRNGCAIVERIQDEESFEEYTENRENIPGNQDSNTSVVERMVNSSEQDRIANGITENTGCDLRIPEIEKRYVHGVYDAIAPHFSSTRFAKWPKVASFLESLAPGSIVIDAGCGNGKYFGLIPNCFFVGCDISLPLVSICAQKGHEVLVADTLSLPYRTGFCDAALSIAVLHHLSTEKRRREAIMELLRVVCRGGKVLITVWAVEQEDRSLLARWTPLTCKYMEEWVGDMMPEVNKDMPVVSLQSISEKGTASEEEEIKVFVGERSAADNYISKQCSCEQEVENNYLSDDKNFMKRNQSEHQEYFIPWHLPYHRAEVGGASAAAVASGLARKDDKKGAIVYNRYYHVFVGGELERLVSTVKGAHIVDHFYDKSNWCVIIEKL